MNEWRWSGITSDPKVEGHAIQLDDEGRVIRGYCGMGSDGVADADAGGPGVW